MRTIVRWGFAIAFAVQCHLGFGEDLRRDGAFGFPQQAATVLCDRADLRFSICNDAEYLFAQAILWEDDDASPGKTEDNREIGDNSSLVLDLDTDGKPTPRLDRDYLLNPWPTLNGLHYSLWVTAGSTSGIQKDSRGRGAVRYLKLPNGKQARVDTFLIPLEELSRKAGEKIGICFFGRSMKPASTVNSVGYQPEGRKTYYAHHIPRTRFHEYALKAAGGIDPLQVPEGRNDISLAKEKTVPMPKVGEAAPELSAAKWINLKEPATLKSLRGKVVLAEFWATWCGPCIEAIPQLNALHEKYGGNKFQLLSFVEEGHLTMDRFLAKRTVKYPIGLESSSLDDYGITGIPHAFLIDRSGKVVWHGHSSSPEMEKAIEAELKRTD